VGNIKAMYNERNQRIEEQDRLLRCWCSVWTELLRPAIPSMFWRTSRSPRDCHQEAQLQREQGMRTKKHITLDEIGRRIAIGSFQELNIIVKGDVDGSIEALSDSLIKLSTPEIQVNVIHKAVGQISESDIMLAVASNAIIVGFQVRPSMNARKLAEKEQIDIRLYSIIYNAIEEIKSAMEGMLSPEIKEEIVATLEIREAFKITKVGTVAGVLCARARYPHDPDSDYPRWYCDLYR
jgi:translation initiation factor IF-2